MKTEKKNSVEVPLLIVDDVLQNLTAFTALLNRNGYRLYTAQSGLEALELASTQEFALILLDVMMPEMDGFELGARLRLLPLHTSTPLIFVSAMDATEANLNRAYTLGAVDFFTKPLNADIVRAKTGVFADLYRARKEVIYQSEALRQQEQRERDQVLEHALDAIVGINSQNLIIDWNLQAEQYFGWSKKEIIGKDMTEILIPERFREGHRQGIKHFLHTEVGKIIDKRIELVALRRNGTEFPMELTVTALKTAGGYKFYSFIKDLTQYRELEHKIKISEESQRAIVAVMNEGIIVRNDKGQIIASNPAAQRILSFSDLPYEERIPDYPEILLLRSDSTPMMPEVSPSALAQSTGKPQRDQEVGVRRKKDGRTTWVIASAEPLFHSGETIPYAVVTSFHDITARKKRVQALRILERASALLSSSLDYNDTFQRVAWLAVPELADWCSIDAMEDSGPVQIAVAHPDPNMLEFAQELREKFPTDWNSPTGAPNVMRTGKSELYPQIPDDLLKRVAKNEEHYEMLVKIGLRSAVVVPLIARGVTLGALTLVSTREHHAYSNEDLQLAEELGRRAGIAIDNAMLYRKSQEAVKARDDFLSIASHELKTPLTPMKLQIGQLIRLKEKNGLEAVTPEKFDRLISIADRSLDRLNGIVEGLLDVSQLNTGKLTIQPENLDLSEVVKGVIDQYQEQASLAGCELSLNLAPKVTGYWDRFRIEQVIVNLVTNAIKYGVGKPIEVAVSTEGDQAKFCVSDQGIGIEKEYQSRIFQRFERAVAAKDFGGMGLGLFIVSRILELHHGSIRVESEAGEGSTFIVLLPRG